MLSPSTLASLALTLGVVSAHGGGMAYEIDGVVHIGNYDELQNPRSIQREWDWNSAEYLDQPWMACGPPGRPAKESYHAPMKVGSTISINYTVPFGLTRYDYYNYEYTKNYEEIRKWRSTFGHERAPMNAFMAPCPDKGCEGVDVNAPIWVKIWEAGLLSGNWTDGLWASAAVYYGANLDIPTPKTLKSGKYLFRHEMNNLANGGQWFPNCIQLDISGDGTKSLPTEVGMAVSFGKADERDAYVKDNGMDGSFCKFPYLGEDVPMPVNCGGSRWMYTYNGHKTEYHMAGPPVWEG